MLAIFRTGLNVGKWCATFGRLGRFIVKRVSGLRSYRYILWDVESELILNELVNNEAEDVVEGMRRRMRRGEKVERVVRGWEEREGGINNNNFRETKRDVIRELALQGLSDIEISRRVGSNLSSVRVVLSILRREGLNIPRRKSGRPRKVEEKIVVPG